MFFSKLHLGILNLPLVLGNSTSVQGISWKYRKIGRNPRLNTIRLEVFHIADPLVQSNKNQGIISDERGSAETEEECAYYKSSNSKRIIALVFLISGAVVLGVVLGPQIL